jgi:protein gp37
MGEFTAIEWATHTLNPWIGCTAVSCACDHCYAEAYSKRTGGPVWGAGQARRRTSLATRSAPLKWDQAAALAGRRDRVFCASLSDFCDAEVPDEWRDDTVDVMRETPNLDWLVLTKRANVAVRYFKGLAAAGRLPGNVAVGTTVETQAMAFQRLPLLRQVPVKLRFVSVEPLLEMVDLEPWLADIGWVIVGGESGPGARPMHPAWARAVRDQCERAGVPYFFKQWGDWAPPEVCGADVPSALALRLRAGALNRHHVFEDLQQMGRIGKKDAGHLLDGHEHRAVPSFQ